MVIRLLGLRSSRTPHVNSPSCSRPREGDWLLGLLRGLYCLGSLFKELPSPTPLKTLSTFSASRMGFHGRPALLRLIPPLAGRSRESWLLSVSYPLERWSNFRLWYPLLTAGPVGSTWTLELDRGGSCEVRPPIWAVLSVLMGPFPWLLYSRVSKCCLKPFSGGEAERDKFLSWPGSEFLKKRRSFRNMLKILYLLNVHILFSIRTDQFYKKHLFTFSQEISNTNALDWNVKCFSKGDVSLRCQECTQLKSKSDCHRHRPTPRHKAVLKNTAGRAGREGSTRQQQGWWHLCPQKTGWSKLQPTGEGFNQVVNKWYNRTDYGAVCIWVYAHTCVCFFPSGQVTCLHMIVCVWCGSVSAISRTLPAIIATLKIYGQTSFLETGSLNYRWTFVNTFMTST